MVKLKANVYIREAIDRFNAERRARGEKAVSTAWVAVQAGIHPNTLDKILGRSDRNPSLDTLAKIAGALGIDDVSEIVAFEVVEESK